MEREVGKKTTEKEMEAVRNDIFNVTSPQQQQQNYIYPQNNGGGFPALFDSSPVGIVYGEGPSSSSSIWSPFSPSLESERLMEFGILDRFNAFQVGNTGQRSVRPETSRNNGSPVLNPFASGYVVGEGFSDQKSNANWASESVANRHFKHLHRLLNSPVMANPIAAPSPCLYRNFQEENSYPYVNGLQQQNVPSDWNMRDAFYLPLSNPEMTHPQLNSRFPMLGHQVGYLPKYNTSDALPHEDKIMFQGNDLQFHNSRRMDRRGRNSDELSSPVSTRPCGSFFRSLKYDSLRDLQGYISFLTKDQQGCRFLQHKLEEKKPEHVEIIFNELIGHVVELMAKSFANYLMQALFEVCTEEQRLKIILVLTKRPFELVELCMNNYGTRAVQKLIDTLRIQQHISMFVSALEPGLLVLIKDLNGNHVIQRCLHCFSSEDNKCVFEAAAKNSVGLATDQYGCCVLQRCIDHSTGQLQNNLIMNIATNGLLLAQHPFGNYAVQFVIENKYPLGNRHLMSLFKGNFVELSKNKFSSNVVEKCLIVWEDCRKIIVLELLSAEHFDMLLQHQYANYVIHRAFITAKGPLHEALVAALKPHADALRTNPYCKKIFSKACFRN